MSWICGLIGSLEPKLKQKISENFKNPIFKIEENELFALAGGNPKTCLFYISKNNDNSENNVKNVILGLGIKKNNDSYKIADENDWKNAKNKEFQNWNGHFIKISISADFIDFFSDEIGLRELFFYKISENCYIFTTNQGKLAKICKIPINFEEFSSRWILLQQITNNSILENVLRINQGKELHFNRKTFDYQLKKTNWLPKISAEYLDDFAFENELEKLATFGLTNNSDLTLSFSGGFDSRLLISFFAKNAHGLSELKSDTKNAQLKAFTFGRNDFLDVKIAKKICDSLNIEHKIVSYEISQKDFETKEKVQVLKEATDYSVMNCAARRISEYIQQRSYLYFKDLNCINIDGCWGEIWRKGLFNKLQFFGKKDLLAKKYDKICEKYLFFHRIDIFNDEINAVMRKSAQLQTEKILHSLPDINEIGVDNFIDIFALKAKLNDLASEQARLDEILVNFMPFVQKSLLEMLFQIKISSRKNAKMFKNIIKKRNKILTKFPLVNGDFQYSLALNTFQIKIIKVINQKLNLGKKNAYWNDNCKIFVDIFRNEILELLTSQKVKLNIFYRQNKIDDLAFKLHKNILTSKDYYELDWWFSLETSLM